MRRLQVPVLNALVVLVILISVNLLAGRVFARLDLTENHEYTLSKATRNILAGLDDVVNIKVYFSKDLPSYFATLDRQVKDLMDEYGAHGEGKVKVEFIDPGNDPALEASLQRMGIPKIQLSRYQQERAEVMSAYLGIAVQFEDKTEVIPVVQSTDRLEYDVTAALLKVSTERKTVGIASAAGASPPEGHQQLQQILQQQYVPRVVDLSQGPVPKDVTTLVVVDDDALTDPELYRIDQFLMGGGKALFLAPGVNVDLRTLAARNRAVKVGPLLRTYGVGVQGSLVVDAQCPMVGFDVGSFFPLSVKYPWFPQVVSDGFSKDNPITSELQGLVMPWTSPLELVPADTSSGAQVHTEILARSSDRSFAAQSPYDLNPQKRISLPSSGVGPQDLVVALSGRFPSHWKGQPVPGDSLGTAPPPVPLSPQTQIVVAGSAQFAGDQFLHQFPSNATFLANAVDWMTLGDDLIAIRSRAAATRPLKDLAEGKAGVLKALAMFPVPLLVILFGLIRAQMRAARRNRYAVEFGGTS